MVAVFWRSVVVLFIMLMVAPAWAQQSQLQREVGRLPWQSYPSVGSISSVAQIKLDNGLTFLDPASTSRFLELAGNPPRSNQNVIAPRSLNWFAVFSFESSGYVRDDDRLDPDELLRTLRKNNEIAKAERQRLNLPILNLDGWAVSPHYDAQTRRLEWGIRYIGDDGSSTVNYTIRILGRSGIMTVILVSDPHNLNQDIQQLRASLRGLDYISGERYAEFRQGDRVAEYGLAALIVGGAAAAAAKAGLLKGLGKFIGVGFFAALAVVAALFKRLFSRKKVPQA